MKTVFITGANRGIGLELAKQLQQKNYHVIAACRHSSTELEALGCQIETNCDVGDLQSVQQVAKKLSDQKIDLIINNAGILEKVSLDNIDYDAMRRQYEINTLGPLRVTECFLPNLRKNAKLAIITSRMGSIEDNNSGGQYGYRASKAAVNMIGSSLAHDLKSKGISVALLHPGYVRTGMTNNNGLIDTDVSATGLIERIEQLNIENTGGFWHTDGTELPW